MHDKDVQAWEREINLYISDKKSIEDCAKSLGVSVAWFKKRITILRQKGANIPLKQRGNKHVTNKLLEIFNK